MSGFRAGANRIFSANYLATAGGRAAIAATVAGNPKTYHVATFDLDVDTGLWTEGDKIEDSFTSGTIGETRGLRAPLHPVPSAPPPAPPPLRIPSTHLFPHPFNCNTLLQASAWARARS
jgi:hypothetical protein